MILPNNKNIVMAAEQATHMFDIPAAVVPTTSIPEGLAALLSFDRMLNLKITRKT